jgi:hypothetical protein
MGVVAGFFLASGLVNAAALHEMECVETSCGAATQGCATNGAACSYCSGSTNGSFCVWMPNEECKQNGTQACGITFSGATCSQHFCSGGAGDPNKPCAGHKCVAQQDPPPGSD